MKSCGLGGNRLLRSIWAGMAGACLIFCAMPAAGTADWVSSVAGAEADAAHVGVALQFRRDFTLASVPRELNVRVSADQRFVLFVNGIRVAAGPSRGDLRAWRYAVIDVAPYLRRGSNVLAAQVWSDGRVAPVAQLSSGTTGFFLAAVDPQYARVLDTGPAWRVRLDPSRTVGSGMGQLIKQVGPIFYAAGGPETIEAASQAPDWAGARTTANGWQAATPALAGAAPWRMVADPLPAQRYRRVDSGRVVRLTGIRRGAFPRRAATVAAHSEVSLLIDAGRVLAAYPVLRTSGGAGANISVTYAEALYDPAGRKRGEGGSWARFSDRARVDDGLALGLTDSFKPDGGKNRFAPFWWRAWRFVELKVKTADQPLTLEGFDTYETGYPFEQRGRFVSDDAQLNEIWRIGWQTALFDAHETYMDTAYWEQLQYIGDARIQMLLSYDVAGDARLAVQAMDAFDSSRQIEGIPQSAWPEKNRNPIPPFALLWIGTMHDYWMRQPDTAPLLRNLAGMRSVLDWYAPYVRESGIVRPTPGWPFIDWRPELNGVNRKDGKGPDSCVVTILYFGALQQAADLESALGNAARGAANLAQARRVRHGLETQCWSPERGLFADTPERSSYSQHANALAVLYDLVPKKDQIAVLDRISSPTGGIDAPAGIVGTTFYFSHYLAEAYDHAGAADRYLPMMKSWRKLLDQHFTTWPENPDPTRSDSHAWSAHPTSGLLAYVAGIKPASPGYAKVTITPHLGTLRRLDAALAHPSGLIETRYARTGRRLSATVTLPPGIRGEFRLEGEVRALRPGRNKLELVLAR